MDNSELYLKMCLVAPKELTKPFTTNDNWFLYSKQIIYCTYHKHFLTKDYDSCWECEHESMANRDLWQKINNLPIEEQDKQLDIFSKTDDFCEDKYWIRLPQQDEIQETLASYIAEQFERVKASRTDLIVAFIDFSVWLGEQYYDEPYVCCPTNVFDSGEQLWFAFAMWEMFSKKLINFEWEVK